jgi:hypothetical protein
MRDTKRKRPPSGKRTDAFSRLLFQDINKAGKKCAGRKIQLYHQR